MAETRQSNFPKYMALTAALLGWMFDGFEMGLFPLAGKPALNDLLGTPDAKVVNEWFGVIIALFLVGAATGGVLFGWLGDKFGRVKAMALSIGAYSIFSGLCAFAGEAWHIAVLRFLASLGMGGEWSLGVALVNEIWPGKSRAFMAGLIGAAANVGFMLVGIIARIVEPMREIFAGMGMSEGLLEKFFGNDAWRFLMVIGALPALLVFFVRLWVPESEKWLHEKEKGATDHWSSADLVGVFLGCLGSLGVVYVWSPLAGDIEIFLRIFCTLLGLGIAGFGFLIPVKQYLKRATEVGMIEAGAGKQIMGRMLFGAGLAGVALLGAWGVLQWVAAYAGQIAGADARANTQIAVALGAIVGTIIAAVVADRFGRRMTYFAICIGSILTAFGLFQEGMEYGTAFLAWGFLAGAIMASFFGFFPFYFPELFPTAVRATAQGFAFNFGRVIAAIGGLQTATLIAAFDGDFLKAAKTMSAIYVVGAILIWFGPETKNELPE